MPWNCPVHKIRWQQNTATALFSVWPALLINCTAFSCSFKPGNLCLRSNEESFTPNAAIFQHACSSMLENYMGGQFQRGVCNQAVPNRQFIITQSCIATLTVFVDSTIFSVRLSLAKDHLLRSFPEIVCQGSVVCGWSSTNSHWMTHESWPNASQWLIKQTEW